MTQDQKDLLLKDLCTRLPYGVKVSVNQSQLQNYDYKWKNWSFDEEPQEIDGVSIYGVTFGCMDMSDGVISFEFIKPYLFPLSSMTEEQKQYLKNRFCYDWNGEPYDLWKYQIEIGDTDELIDWFHKNHIDYRGLIPMGLANDATGLNIY